MSNPGHPWPGRRQRQHWSEVIGRLREELAASGRSR